MSTAKTALSLLALLLGYWTSSAAQPPITSPLIVATVQLLSQTTGIPPTNIFTPQADGLFRISVYTTTTKSHPHALGWFFHLRWSDDGRQHDAVGPHVVGHPAGVWETWTSTFSAKAGTPVTFSVVRRGENPAGMTYDLLFTVEQLQ